MTPTHSETPATAIPSSTPALPLPNSRLVSLDVLRGVAVLGALFISVWIFGGFSNNQQNGLLLKSKGYDYRLFGTVDLLLNGKMRALISLVFGAGMVIYFFSHVKKDQSKAGDYFTRRYMWLMLLGLVNALVFLWTGDMLFHLGVMGILLFPFVRMSKKGLLIAALVTTLIYCGKFYWDFADDRKKYNKFLLVQAAEKKITEKAKKDSIDNIGRKDTSARVMKDSLGKDLKKDSLAVKKDTLTKEQKRDKGAWEGIVNQMKFDPKKDEGERKSVRKNSYGRLWNHFLPTLQSKEAQWTYQKGIWDFTSMILLGMALFKMGFFSPGFSRRNYWLLALAGISLGLLLGWFRLHYNQITLQDYGKYIERHWVPYNFFFPLERAFTALGYAGFILVIIGSNALNRFWRGLAAAGQMALTNYLLQSIICTLVFTGFGLGNYGRFSQTLLYLTVLEISLVLVVFSVLWLRHYRYGPAEWLWRCLIYRRWLPNKLDAGGEASATATVIS